MLLSYQKQYTPPPERTNQFRARRPEYSEDDQNQL